MAATWRESDYRLLEHGESIEVGDVIVGSHFLGSHRFRIHRVTKRYAIVWFNDTAEGRYPRTYSDYGFQSFPRSQWSMTKYKVYRLKA